MTEDSSQKADDRGQRADDRGQRAENRWQRMANAEGSISAYMSFISVGQTTVAAVK